MSSNEDGWYAVLVVLPHRRFLRRIGKLHYTIAIVYSGLTIYLS